MIEKGVPMGPPFLHDDPDEQHEREDGQKDTRLRADGGDAEANRGRKRERARERNCCSTRSTRRHGSPSDVAPQNVPA